LGQFRSSGRAAQRGRITPGQQLRAGVFAVLAVIAIFAVYLVLNNVVARRNGYTIAVHFRNVGGLQEGSNVQVAGVNVGFVTELKLLPDQTVTAVCSIQPNVKIYRESQFLVTSTLTGAATLAVSPPRDLALAAPLQPGVPPEDQQPWGGLPPSFNDLIAEIQPRIKELDKTLALVDRQLPRLTTRFNTLAGHTDTLITDTDATLRNLSSQMGVTLASLDSVLGTSGRSIDQLTGTMNATLAENRDKIDRLTANLAAAASNLNQTMGSLASVAKDPQFKANLLQTTTNLKDTSEKVKKIAGDIESITGDPQVQANLKGAVYDLSSAIAKANDVLGGFSGAAAHGPAPAGSTPAPSPSGGSPRPRLGFRGFSAASLLQTQVRETWNNGGLRSGPQSDVNFVLLPGARTHVTLGANDLGYNTSYNLTIDRRLSPKLQISGGVLYSNLGVRAIVQPIAPLGVDARLYDPRHPKFDLYGNVKLFKRLQLFYGQRNIFNAPNRFGPSVSTPAFGFETQY